VRSILLLGAFAVALVLSAASLPDRRDRPVTAAEVVLPDGGTQLEGAGADRAGLIGESGEAITTACELVSQQRVEEVVDELAREDRGPLERTANDSLDLSFCEFRETEGPELFVKIGLDTAPHAVRRYYNMITEARQLPNIFDPSEDQRPKLVFGIGDDGTYGGAGAYWVPVRLDLTAIKDRRIVKTHIYLPGSGQRRLKQAAAELARLAFAGYERAERRAGT
jgi:hypothetical protein